MRKLISLIFALVIFNLFFFKHFFPLPGTLFFLLLIITSQIFLILAFFNFHRPSHIYNLAFQGLSILAQFLALFRASYIDRNLMFLLSVGLFLLSTYIYLKEDQFILSLTEAIMAPFRLVREWIIHLFATILYVPGLITWLIATIKKTPGIKSFPKEKNFALLRGIIVAVPIVFLVLALLMSADPIFAKLLTNVFDFDFLSWIVLPVRLAQTIVVGFLLSGLLIAKIKNDFISPFADKKRWGQFSTEASIVVSLIALVLAVFLVVQFRYLFTSVPETQLQKFGINTYSEYVRKGFQELLIVSMIVYLTSGLSMVIQRVKRYDFRVLKWLNVTLLIETIIFISSIFRRVLLYQAEHGLTRIRAYGSIFLLLLMILTVLLICRQLINKKINWYLMELSVVFFSLIVSSLVGIDQTISEASPPTVNNQIDYNYLVRLSADSHQAWAAGFEHTQQQVDQVSVIASSDYSPEDLRQIVYGFYLINNFKSKYEDLVSKYGDQEAAQIMGVKINDYRWREFNVSEWFAYNQLKKKISAQQTADLAAKIRDLYYNLTPDQKHQPLDRSFDTPLLY